MIPPCDHTGVPIHFHSSTTSGSASFMSLRILLNVLPRQPPSSAILLSMSSDAEWLSADSDFFTFSSCGERYDDGRRADLHHVSARYTRLKANHGMTKAVTNRVPRTARRNSAADRGEVSHPRSASLS